MSEKFRINPVLIFDERVTKSFWDATAFFKAIKSRPIDDRGFFKCENQGIEPKFYKPVLR